MINICVDFLTHCFLIFKSQGILTRRSQCISEIDEIYLTAVAENLFLKEKNTQEIYNNMREMSKNNVLK